MDSRGSCRPGIFYIPVEFYVQWISPLIDLGFCKGRKESKRVKNKSCHSVLSIQKRDTDRERQPGGMN